MNTVIIHKFQNLPEAAQSIIMDFIDFMTLKHKKTGNLSSDKNKKQHFGFKWEGALSEHKKKYTSVELKHKATEWRNI